MDNARKCLYEGVVVLTALYGAEAWVLRGAERKKVNVLEICLRSLVGVSRMDGLRNEEVRMRAGIERESASRADQRVLRWFGHVERMDEYSMARGVDGGSKWRADTSQTEVRLVSFDFNRSIGPRYRVFSPREKKEGTFQYGYRTWGTSARVFSHTLTHGNSKNDEVSSMAGVKVAFGNRGMGNRRWRLCHNARKFGMSREPWYICN